MFLLEKRRNHSLATMRVKRRGFTLIEIIAVFLLIGILAAVVVPKYVDMQKEAADKAAQGVIAAYQAECSLNFAKSILKEVSFICPPIEDIQYDPVIFVSVLITPNPAGPPHGSCKVEVTHSKGSGVQVGLWNAPVY